MAPKRNLFNKPSWASKPAAEVKEDAPIFTSNAYEGILKAQKEREEKRLAREKTKEDERAQNDSQRSINTQIEGQKAVKKRRISLADDDLDEEEAYVVSSGSEQDFGHNNSAGGNVNSDSDDQLTTNRNTKKPQSKPSYATRQSPRGKPSVTSKSDVFRTRNGRLKNAMTADDDDDDIQVTKTIARTKATPSKLSARGNKSDTDSEEDETIKELKRAARAEARQYRERSHAGLSPEKQRQSTNQSPTDLKDLTSSTSIPVSSPTTTTSVVPDETLVEILITTIIPGANQLVVSRKASQTLSHVRTYWCERNGLEPLIADKVFFIWNGSQLYDTTTMRGILDHIKRKHGTKSDGSDLAEGKVHLEAVTQEIFDFRKEQKERAKAEALRLLSPSLSQYQEDFTIETNDQDDNSPVKPSKDRASTSIIIHLKTDPALKIETMDLRVYQDTSIAKITRGYVRTQGLSADVEAGRKEVYLLFDGERMNDDDTIADVDWEEGEQIEVRIKDLS